jgi:hypothetical protein
MSSVQNAGVAPTLAEELGSHARKTMSHALKILRLCESPPYCGASGADPDIAAAALIRSEIYQFASK